MVVMSSDPHHVLLLSVWLEAKGEAMAAKLNEADYTSVISWIVGPE